MRGIEQDGFSQGKLIKEWEKGKIIRERIRIMDEVREDGGRKREMDKIRLRFHWHTYTNKGNK